MLPWEYKDEDIHTPFQKFISTTFDESTFHSHPANTLKLITQWEGSVMVLCVFSKEIKVRELD